MSDIEKAIYLLTMAILAGPPQSLQHSCHLLRRGYVGQNGLSLCAKMLSVLLEL
jgi:hypothetical protein